MMSLVIVLHRTECNFRRQCLVACTVFYIDERLVIGDKFSCAVLVCLANNRTITTVKSCLNLFCGRCAFTNLQNLVGGKRRLE